MTDHAELAQKAAEKHLAACNDYLWELEKTDPYPDEDTEPECPWSAPYCGCDTCVVREVLWAGWQHLEALTKEAA